MKNWITIALFAFISFNIFAQPIYNASDYGGIGDRYDFSGAATDSVYINPILNISGEQVEWNFEDLQLVDQYSAQVESKEESGYQGGFLLTCISATGDPFECNRFWNQEVEYAIPVDGAAFGGQFTDVKIFRKLENNLLTEAIIGLSVDNDGAPVQLGFPYTQIDTIIEFPLEYGKTFTAPSAFAMDFSVFQVPFAYFHEQVRTSTVDAYGTLITPFAEYTDVLRLATEVVYDDIVEINGQSIPLPRVEYIYEWYEKSEKAPILEIRADVPTFGGALSISSVRYLDTLRCLDPVALFNPDAISVELIDGEAVVSFNNRSSLAYEFEWDFGDGSTSMEEFPTHTYTQEGGYTVTLTACNTVCDPSRCSEFSLNIEVIELTSTEEALERDLSFVYDLHNESLTLLELNGQREVKIFSSFGKEVKSVRVENSTEQLDVSSLHPGLYYLSWISDHGVLRSKAWMKY